MGDQRQQRLQRCDGPIHHDRQLAHYTSTVTLSWAQLQTILTNNGVVDDGPQTLTNVNVQVTDSFGKFMGQRPSRFSSRRPQPHSAAPIRRWAEAAAFRSRPVLSRRKSKRARLSLTALTSTTTACSRRRIRPGWRRFLRTSPCARGHLHDPRTDHRCRKRLHGLHNADHRQRRRPGRHGRPRPDGAGRDACKPWDCRYMAGLPDRGVIPRRSTPP